MRHNSLFFAVILISIIFVSVDIPPAICLTTYWFNLCNTTTGINKISTCTLSINTTSKQEGSGSLQINYPAADNVTDYKGINLTISGTVGLNTVMGFWFKNGLITDTCTIGEWIDSSTGYFVKWNYYSGGYFGTIGDDGSYHGGSSGTLITNSWYWLEIWEYNGGGSPPYNYEFYLNGTFQMGFAMSTYLNVTNFETLMYVGALTDRFLQYDYVRIANTLNFPPTTTYEYTVPSPFVYVHTFTPTAIAEGQLSNYPKIYRVILNQSLTFVYTQTIYNQTYSNVTAYPINGTFYVLTSGIYKDYPWTNETFIYVQVLTGVIVNGNFSFIISSRTSSPSQRSIYESLEVITIIDNPFPIHSEQYEIRYDTPNPIVNPNFPAANGLDLTSWLVLFLIILCPIMVLGCIFGKSGLLIGMVYSIGIGVATHLLDPWFIVVIVITLVAELYDMSRGR